VPRPSEKQCLEQLETATSKLNIHHISAITGIPYTHIKKMLDAGEDTPKTFTEMLSKVFEIHKTYKDVSDLETLTEEDRENNLDYQTLRLRKASADLKEQEYQARERGLAPREELELVLSHAAVLASKTLDGLVPEIQQLLPSAKAHVIDAIATRIADARNAIADAQLPG